jgi:hypothetical protein
VGCAGVDLGVVRPACSVNAIGGSKIPNKLFAQDAHNGSKFLTIGGIENCGLQIYVMYWCRIESYWQFVVHLHLLTAVRDNL